MPSRDRPCADRSAISRSRAMSFAEYRRLRPPTRVGATRPSRSYWRSVCGCSPASDAATEIAYTGASSATLKPVALGAHDHAAASRSSPPPPARRGPCADRGRPSARRTARSASRASLDELLRHRHLDRRQQVAVGAVLATDPLAAHPEGAAVGGAGRDLERDRSAPRGVGTAISPPSAASANVTGTVTVTLSPLRSNTGCGSMVTSTKQVAVRAAVLARRALALEPDARAVASRRPGCAPARCAVLRPRPEPWQVGHGSSTKSPRPWQVTHGSANAKPPALRRSGRIRRRSGTCAGTVPALAPVPWQLVQGASRRQPQRDGDAVQRVVERQRERALEVLRRDGPARVAPRRRDRG